ncbi:hypothetical protein AVEN_86866-1 [Araneus ventricosus]|uniref:Uncharacterized protein n=1 Tax=Araneus ventricosus TaxID=182803 RepID=A0A4Y2QQ83_ARAVE|nr:hypothetical protein AVEN_86866-1 [Araneus ventricosus]
MSCFVFCVDFVPGPEPMEVDDWSCEEMDWEPADTIEPMEWEEAFLPPQNPLLEEPSLSILRKFGQTDPPLTTDTPSHFVAA